MTYKRPSAMEARLRLRWEKLEIMTPDGIREATPEEQEEYIARLEADEEQRRKDERFFHECDLAWRKHQTRSLDALQLLIILFGLAAFFSGLVGMLK